MTARELSKDIGATVQLYDGKGLSFPVIVRDARFVWQKLQWLVAPVGGIGERWVSPDSCSLISEAK